MIDVAIIGAAGYTGAELTRLVAGHPGMRLVAVTSTADAGRRVDDLYPALAGIDLIFVEPDVDGLAERADLVFLAVPHTAAMAVAPALLDAGLAVIDLSADFRLADVDVYERWYGADHTAPGLLGQAVYGLPELTRAEIAGARLVACPGCYPTATLLAAVPALRSKLAIGGRIVVDAKSGVSGAGRAATATTHFCSANEAVLPYKVASHRHVPEMEQGLERAAGRPIKVAFTPTLVPMTRGMLSTVYLDAAPGTTTDAMIAAFCDIYADEPFITVHPAGRMPSTAEVRGSNRAHIGIAVDEHSGTAIVTCAIDNLVKGAAGQAVQCANVVLGADETTGLSCLGPVV